MVGLQKMKVSLAVAVRCPAEKVVPAVIKGDNQQEDTEACHSYLQCQLQEISILNNSPLTFQTMVCTIWAVMQKNVFGISDQERLNPVCSAIETTCN